MYETYGYNDVRQDGIGNPVSPPLRRATVEVYAVVEICCNKHHPVC